MSVKQESNPAVLFPSREEAPVLLKRIGSTTYVVSIYFSKTNTETMDDKLIRLIEKEAMGA